MSEQDPAPTPELGRLRSVLRWRVTMQERQESSDISVVGSQVVSDNHVAAGLATVVQHGLCVPTSGSATGQENRILTGGLVPVLFRHAQWAVWPVDGGQQTGSNRCP